MRRRLSDNRQEETKPKGQLVLVAAVALAVTLVPLVLAYLQLGYHDDIRPGTSQTPAQQADSTLTRGVHDAATGIPAEYSWERRAGAVDAVLGRLEPTVRAVRNAGLDDGSAYTIGYNQTRATDWADENCPGGVDRRFGSCLAQDGVVIQEREGRTHVLAVAVDIEITAEDSTTQLSSIIDIEAG